MDDTSADLECTITRGIVCDRAAGNDITIPGSKYQNAEPQSLRLPRFTLYLSQPVSS